MGTMNTDQTGQMPRLICVFAGRTCHFVGFAMRRLITVSLTGNTHTLLVSMTVWVVSLRGNFYDY